MDTLLKKKLSKLPEDVYLSFDLDVMDEEIIETYFEQGTLKTEELLRAISVIKQTKNIIGADILGYKADGKGKELYREIVDALIE